jgi:hypothetical protein
MVHHLMLTRDTTATPEDPGKIILCHRLSRYEAMIGQPTPFDNQLNAFIGDSSNGQLPITIIMPPGTSGQDPVLAVGGAHHI